MPQSIKILKHIFEHSEHRNVLEIKMYSNKIVNGKWEPALRLSIHNQGENKLEPVVDKHEYRCVYG